jgi:hypothetical protein
MFEGASSGVSFFVRGFVNKHGLDISPLTILKRDHVDDTPVTFNTLEFLNGTPVLLYNILDLLIHEVNHYVTNYFFLFTFDCWHDSHAAVTGSVRLFSFDVQTNDAKLDISLRNELA